MQFEEFDKKLREAADHHHPAYNEKAWEKMEKLLNKHMPEEKDRRRILFFVILLFLGLGGAGLIIFKPWKNSDTVAVEKAKGADFPVPKTEIVPNKTIETNQEVKPSIDLVLTQSSLRTSPVINRQQSRLSTTEKELVKKPLEKRDEFQPNNSTTLLTGKKTNEPLLTNKNLQAEDPFSLKPETKATSPAPTEQPLTEASPPKKAKSKKQHAVFVSVSGGPDLSFVQGNTGKVKLFAGAGIGYAYNNRLSIRTGFYSGRKIYTAGPEAYNPPPGFYVYYPYLEKVEANCEIYEVPVQLSYHFGKSPDRKFFASAGVSSYIMKEEQYKYYYKYSLSGPTVNMTRTIRDKNQHLLAGLTLSAGYSRRLTRHISLTAEPYVKLPLKGVGYGKVKLNSAGVSMSMSVNPFAKKPK